MKLGHTQTCTHTNNDDVELNHAWNPQPSACSHIHTEAYVYTSTLTCTYLLFIHKDQRIAKLLLLNDLKVDRVSHGHSLDLSLPEIKVWPLTHRCKQTLAHAGLLWPRYWLFCFPMFPVRIPPYSLYPFYLLEKLFWNFNVFKYEVTRAGWTMIGSSVWISLTTGLCLFVWSSFFFSPHLRVHRVYR